MASFKRVTGFSLKLRLESRIVAFWSKLTEMRNFFCLGAPFIREPLRRVFRRGVVKPAVGLNGRANARCSILPSYGGTRDVRFPAGWRFRHRSEQRSGRRGPVLGTSRLGSHWRRIQLPRHRWKGLRGLPGVFRLEMDIRMIPRGRASTSQRSAGPERQLRFFCLWPLFAFSEAQKKWDALRGRTSLAP